MICYPLKVAEHKIATMTGDLLELKKSFSTKQSMLSYDWQIDGA